MTTLRIEHEIHDFAQWEAAFDRFAEVRATAGVRAHAVRRPVEDPRFVTIDLEFDTVEAATAFDTFLHERVWSSPEASPALAGTPRTRLLDVMSVTDPDRP